MAKAEGKLDRSSEGRVLGLEVDSCSVRRRSGFPWVAGPLVLSSGCSVHDGFQTFFGLSDVPTLMTGSP